MRHPIHYVQIGTATFECRTIARQKTKICKWSFFAASETPQTNLLSMWQHGQTSHFVHSSICLWVWVLQRMQRCICMHAAHDLTDAQRLSYFCTNAWMARESSTIICQLDDIISSIINDVCGWCITLLIKIVHQSPLCYFHPSPWAQSGKINIPHCHFNLKRKQRARRKKKNYAHAKKKSRPLLHFYCRFAV